jgi:hypothetical protein
MAACEEQMREVQRENEELGQWGRDLDSKMADLHQTHKESQESLLKKQEECAAIKRNAEEQTAEYKKMI